MALVLKGFTRDGKYVDLPGQTEALLLAAGWAKHDEWRRELWSLSFWRILQRRRDPAAFDDRLLYETVLAFTKPEGAGGGVAAILTSPPYENSELPREEHDDSRSDGIYPRYRYTRPVSLVVTSPPYENQGQGQGTENHPERMVGSETGLGRGYTRPGGAP